ncbi:MAG: hypothetical protein HPY50_06585 [Firmicutes bacterium]|nr:hypothetical protein [Bacillota bacterium]
MKIGIIGNNNLNYLPYLKKYTDILEETNTDYEVVTWDRTLTEQEDNEKILLFKYLAPLNNSKVKKIKDYLMYYRFVKQVLKNKKYNRLIILTPQTGIIFIRLLKNKYPQKYIFDIRDFTYDNFYLYRFLMNLLVENSIITIVSSPAFNRWLPKSKKYILSHNIDNTYFDYFVNRNREIDLDQVRRIRICFIGMIRPIFYRDNKKLITALANHKNFELHYLGEELVKGYLKKFCVENQINNVYFRGKYQPKEKIEFYGDTDLLNGIFGSRNLEVCTLIPNRLYESCILRKPILVSANTYLAKIVMENGLGLALDFDNDNLADKILNYYKNLEYEEYDTNCKKYLEQVRIDEEIFKRTIKKIIS